MARRARSNGVLGAVFAAATACPLAGCHVVGQAAHDAFAACAATFAPNPVAVIPFYGGAALGFLAAAPLLLFSWPLTAVFHADDQGYSTSAALAPSLTLAAVTGGLVAAPFYAVGAPFLPDVPEGDAEEPGG